LIEIRGKWVHVSSEEIKAAIDFLKRKAPPKATVRDLVKFAFGIGSPLVDGAEITVEARGWVGDLLDPLEEPTKIEDLPAPEGFVGQLRPYQERGYSWLSYLTRWGLGACLADDMGLGKTIQTLVMIQAQR